MSVESLVLASGSPRRRDLLGRLGLEFAVRAPDIDERRHDGEVPTAYVSRLAAEKAATVEDSGAVVIAADTAVVVDEEVLGKPRDVDDARTMILRLQGRDHQVVTAVAIRANRSGRFVVGTERSTVSVDPLGPGRLQWYLDSGEGTDKAGAYALQGAGALFADRVDGSVTNVVGLPLPLVDRLCTEVGVDLLSFRSRS